MRHGVSLVETLVAMAVLVVFIAIAVPAWIQRFSATRDLDETVSTVVDGLYLAKTLALQSAVPHAYQYESAGHWQKVIAIDQRKEIKRWAISPKARIELKPGTTGWILFRSDGSTDASQIEVFVAGRSQNIVLERSLSIPSFNLSESSSRPELP